MSPWQVSVRRQFWHFRHGGLEALRRHRSRRHLRTDSPAVQHPERMDAGDVQAWPLPSRPPRRSLRVGVVLDEFSTLALDSEWVQVPLTQQGWSDELSHQDIDLLFVESAWNANSGSWRYALTGAHAPSQSVRDLVEYCRGRDIPTVFWNKEDPVHFDDFIGTASLFDVVLTTDADMISAYVERLGHESVYSMPFAAASWIHNPMRSSRSPVRDIAFAGMYFAHKYPSRRQQMDVLLGAAADAAPRLEHGFDIFSRFHGTEDRYQFPEPFAQHVVGSLTYRQMLSAYRQYKVLLNVSSVPDSSTMCPRRVYEVSACATAVVTCPSRAVSSVFSPDEILTVSQRSEAQWTLRALVGNDEWRQRITHRAARRVLAQHTYSDRVDDLLAQIGLEEHRVFDPTVSVLAVTNRPHQLRHLMEQVAAQQELSPQLVLVTHGFRAPENVLAQGRTLGLDSVVVHEAAGSSSLGACLNVAAGLADGQLLAKMDDDDLYGPHYLADQRRALDFSGADVVGKHAHYMNLQSLDALVLRFPLHESTWTDLVVGPTLMMPADVIRDIPFRDRTRGEDTTFLREVMQNGGRIYASDRFNFVQVRRSTGHTWDVSNSELLANSRLVAYGTDARHAFV